MCHPLIVMHRMHLLNYFQDRIISFKIDFCHRQRLIAIDFSMMIMQMLE